MTSLWTRASTIVALTAAATLGLTACSGDAAPATSGQEASATPGAESPKPASSELLTMETFSERLSAAQLAAGSVHNEIITSMQGQKQTMSGDTVISAKPEDMQMSLVTEMPGGDSMEVRLVDGKLFINMGEMSKNQFVETPLDGAAGAQFSALMESNDPQQQLEMLTDATKDFQVADATEKIDGVETRAYTLTLDTKTLLKDQAELLAAAGNTLPETVEYVLHIGSDDLPRRYVMTMGDTVTTTNFSDWGKAVTIQAPPADQITDGAALGF